jgi:hypothetical protein
VNSETVPTDVILVLSTLAGLAGALLTALLGWLEAQRGKQHRLAMLAPDRFRDRLADSKGPDDLSAHEALAEVDKL